jgi:hypothetical protein
MPRHGDALILRRRTIIAGASRAAGTTLRVDDASAERGDVDAVTVAHAVRLVLAGAAVRVAGDDEGHFPYMVRCA